MIIIFEGKLIVKPFFFSERVVFEARNDRKLVQTCQSSVILPFRFNQSNKEHLTGFRVVYQSGISLNLRTGPDGHATLFNQ